MAKRKLLTLQEQYDILSSNCSEMRDYIHELLEDQQYYQTELDYLQAFIEYKGLNEDYQYFREHAYPKHSDDVPFPTLTL